MTDTLAFPDDLPAVAADDAALDALAAGEVAVAVDDTVELLAEWRDELDAAATAAPLLTQRATGPARWTRAKRRGAAVAAVTLALATSTGVAAAAGGPHGPLGEINRVLFGAPATAPKPDVIAARVRALLDTVAAQVRTARAAGGVTAAQRRQLDNALDDAATMLATDPQTPAGLQSRIDALRGAVAALPALPTPPAGPAVTPSPDRHGGSGSGSDDATSGDDRTGSDDGGQVSGDGGSGTGTGGSDDGSGSTGTSGSSDGSGSTGTSGSGDGSGDTQATPSPTSTSGGSDGGSSGGSADLTTSGSDDGGSSGGSGTSSGGGSDG